MKIIREDKENAGIRREDDDDCKLFSFASSNKAAFILYSWIAEWSTPH